MEKNNEEVYSLAKKMIRIAINKINRDKYIQIGKTRIDIDISNAEEMKHAVEMSIMSPLAYEVDETPPNITEEIKNEIGSIMSVFKEVYEEVYSQNEAKVKEEISEDKKDIKEKTIQEKADDFNKMIKEQMDKIPKDYLRKVNEMRKKQNIKPIKHIPIYKGEFNEEVPNNKKEDSQLGDR